MRDDDDPIRQYVPMLRRLIILMVVLTAIPVMWTITASVRAYVGPPKLPTFRHLADSANATPPQTTASRTDKIETADQNPTTSVATKSGLAAPDATTPTDGRTNAAADTAPAIVAALPSANPPDSTTDQPTANTTPDAASPFATTRPPDAATSNTATAPAWPAAADAAPPPAQGLAGPVPLPRKRPRTLHLALSAVPLPRPRPEASVDAALPPTQRTPLNWFQHIFHPDGGGAGVTAADDSSSAQPVSR